MHAPNYSKFKTYILPAIVAGVLIVGIFMLGIYVGERQASSRIPESLGISTSSGSQADLDMFWKVWSILNEKFVGDKKPADKEKIYGAISGLANSYGDPYTTFFPPVESKNFAAQVSGSFEGVGMEVDMNKGQLVVVAPLKDSPAEKAGVLSGDAILKIDGKSTTGLNVQSAVNLIRGPKGTTVTLTVGRSGKKAPFDIPIVRQPISIPSVNTDLRKDGIFVISLYNFSAPSANDFRNALRKFVDSGSDKLIIDLRNNPGGYLEAAVSIASWFLPVGDVIVSEDFGSGKTPQIHAALAGQDIFNDKLKMIVLINGGSASASEILAGALHDHNRARLLGEKSFGKGSVQELVDTGEGTSLKVTIARWLTPSGISISHNGITPDIVVPMTQDDFIKNGDMQLAKAAEILNKETASTSGQWILKMPQFTVTPGR